AEIVDVLARGALPGGPPAGHRVGPGGVPGEVLSLPPPRGGGPGLVEIPRSAATAGTGRDVRRLEVGEWRAFVHGVTHRDQELAHHAACRRDDEGLTLY